MIWMDFMLNSLFLSIPIYRQKFIKIAILLIGRHAMFMLLGSLYLMQCPLLFLMIRSICLTISRGRKSFGIDY